MIDAEKPERWAIYYDYRLSAEHFADYNLVVFDSVAYPDFRRLPKKTKVLAHINLNQTLNEATEIAAIKQRNLAPEKQKSTEKSNSGGWQSTVMRKVDNAVNKGFDGVLLDKGNSALNATAAFSPQSTADAKKSYVSLIHAIHEKHPSINIMLNQSLDILPDVADKIDYVLAEGILTDFNLFAGQSRLNDSHSYQQTAAALRWARNLSPKIKIYTLDYWDMSDVDTVKKIYRLQRAQGFSPYVAAPDLHHYTPEPK